MSYSSDEKKQLEQKIRQQNLIQELVMINQVLLMEETKLRKQVEEIPKLKQKIEKLKKENQQMTGQQIRTEQVREEALIQTQQGFSFAPYYKLSSFNALGIAKRSDEVAKEKTFSSEPKIKLNR